MSNDSPDRHAAVYIRVSPGARKVAGLRQEEVAISLEVQEERCKARALSDGRTNIVVYRDEFKTSSTLHRPGLQKLLRAATNGEVEALYILRLDRLTGNIEDLARMLRLCEEKDIDFVSVQEGMDTGTPMGEAMAKILVVVREMTLKQGRERTTEAMRQLARQGKAIGNAPFGMQCDPPLGEPNKKGEPRMLVRNEEEMKLLHRMLVELIYEGKAYTEIAEGLNKDGLTNRRGNPWTRMNIYNLLRDLDLEELRSIV